MKTSKVKKCSICKSEYTPYSSLAKACSPKCALEVVAKKKAKQYKKELNDYRIETKKISQWIAEAQKQVNNYIRARDHNKPCISCGCETVRSFEGYRGACGWDSGHFRSTGSAPHLRFNLNNIAKQCVSCNRDKSGNVNEYRIGLINRIGIEKVEAIESNNGYKKYTREYCERVKRIFAKKTRMQKKRLGL